LEERRVITMKRMWRAGSAMLAAFMLGTVLAAMPGVASADQSVNATGYGAAGGAQLTPEYQQGNAQGDGSGR
jgi:hypothetical protein